MPESILELKDALSRATDSQGNVLDSSLVNHVIVSLENMTVTPEDLQVTRIGKLVNDVRRRAKGTKLAKRIEKLVKKWQNLLENYVPSIVNTTVNAIPNGIVQTENGLNKTHISTDSPASHVAQHTPIPNNNNILVATTKLISRQQSTNSAPHPITDGHKIACPAKDTIIAFVHPPVHPEPMPSSLVISIPCASVRLKRAVVDCHIANSTGQSIENNLTSVGDLQSCVLNNAHPLKDPQCSKEDDYLGKFERFGGKATPIDEILSDGYLLDIDFSSSLPSSQQQYYDTSSGSSGCQIHGVTGCYSLDGIWYDWTQPIPSSKEDAVSVLPYVYID